MCWHWEDKEKGKGKGCLREDTCKFKHPHAPDCGGRCGGTRYCRSKPCKNWEENLQCRFCTSCTFEHRKPCKSFMKGECDGTDCCKGSHPGYLKNKDLCWHWVKYGKCVWYENGFCVFGHSSKHQGMCKHHLAGGCYHGNECLYYHP